MTPNVNEVAPDFSLPDSTGATRTLTELVGGQRRILIFYRGHW
jgi:peroxiredoxin